MLVEKTECLAVIRRTLEDNPNDKQQATVLKRSQRTLQDECFHVLGRMEMLTTVFRILTTSPVVAEDARTNNIDMGETMAPITAMYKSMAALSEIAALSIFTRTEPMQYLHGIITQDAGESHLRNLILRVETPEVDESDTSTDPPASLARILRTIREHVESSLEG
jgi:hypothetical protein